MKRTQFTILLALALAALACALPGSGGGSVVPTLIPTPAQPAAPAPTPETAPAPGGGANPDVLNLDDPAIYAEIEASDYSVDLDFNFTGLNADGTTLFRQLLINGQRNYEPPESYFRIEANDPAVIEGMESLEIADIEGADYLYSPAIGCVVTSNPDEDNPFDVLLDTGGLLTGEARRVESGVVVNGVATDRYEITLDNIDLDDSAGMDVRSLQQGSLYLAQEGGAVIRLVLDGRGVSEVLTGDPAFEGDIHYQFDATPSDTPFIILPPLGCLNVAESFPYPLTEDAAGISALAGLYSFTTETPFEELVAFYKAEMEARGYSITQEGVTAPLATITFANETETVQVFIGPSASGTGSTVVITAAP